jgi:hypothetical protein
LRLQPGDVGRLIRFPEPINQGAGAGAGELGVTSIKIKVASNTLRIDSVLLGVPAENRIAGAPSRLPYHTCEHSIVAEVSKHTGGVLRG